MRPPVFSPAELLELMAADAEIERTFYYTREELEAARLRDSEMLPDADKRKRQAERSHRWYLANQELAKERSRIWRADNPDRVKAYSKEYRVAHRAELIERDRLYRQQHRDEINARRRERRQTARKSGM